MCKFNIAVAAPATKKGRKYEITDTVSYRLLTFANARERSFNESDAGPSSIYGDR
jgi:hypothetical protein